MRRLTGFDASFLYSESPTVLMHTLKVAVIEPPKHLRPADRFDRLRSELGRLLDKLPAFRLRLVEVPLGLDHPVWIEDPHFDLDYHLHRIALPPPCGPRELDAVIADIAGHPLDRGHPLWEIWMVEGLAGGELAFVLKIHHAVADGGASAAMLANVMTREAPSASSSQHPDGETAAANHPAGEELPEPLTLVRDALRDQVRRAGGALPLAARTVRGGIAVLRGYRGAGARPPMPFDTPRTPFNEPLTPARSFASTALSLAAVKQVKDAFGVTLNDVVLGLAGGALARYLDGRGLHADRSLIATVPVSIAEPGGAGGSPRLSGNRLSNVFMSLCTDIADPRERLRRIHDIAEAAKATHERLGPQVLVEWAEFAPPKVSSWAIRSYSSWKLARLHRPAANAIVSNVRGPSEKLFVGGAKLSHMYSVGPILDGIGVNLTAWSYGDELSFGVLTGREAVPDAHEITDGLHAALAELTAAAAPKASGSKAGAGPRRPRVSRNVTRNNTKKSR